MVSILPAERSSADVIGNQIGENLNRNLPGVTERAQNRQMGLSAIDQLQADLNNAGGDINKILPAIAKAYTLNPNLERSGIAEHALSRAKAGVNTSSVNKLIDEIRGGTGKENNQPLPEFLQGIGRGGNSNQPQANSNQEIETQKPPLSKSPNQPNQGIFLSQSLPQNISELITPEQKARTLEDVANRGGDVNATRQAIDDYNQGKISFNDLANSNVEKQAANTQRMLGFEDQIKKKIDNYLPAETPEAEKNIYYNKVRDALENSESFSEAWQKVSADIDNFRKLNEAYVKNIPEANIQGINTESEKSLRNSAKPIMEQDPLAYNVLEQAYMSKGHSPIVPAKILKPLPPQIKSILSKAGDYKDLIYPGSSWFHEVSDAEMQRNIDTSLARQDKDIAKLVPKLRDDWNENLSLLNMYADLRAKGWNLNKITTLFDDVSDKFSPRQKAERVMINQELRVPPRYLGFFGEEK